MELSAAEIAELIRKVERHEEAIERLDGWQEAQNGHLQHLSERMDGLASKDDLRELRAKVDKLVYGVFVWALTQLAGIIVTLLIKKG